MDFSSDLVNVESPRHHDMLISGLWNFFKVNHAVDFEISWEGRSIRAHQLILDVFLSPRQPHKRQAPSLREQQSKSSMDLLMEFLYNGRVDVPREKLQNLLDVAKELDFAIMVEAVEIAIVNDKANCLFGEDICSSRPVVRSSYVPVQRNPPPPAVDSVKIDSVKAVPPTKSVDNSNYSEKGKSDEADVGNNDGEVRGIEGGDGGAEQQSEIQLEDGQSSGKSYLSLTDSTNHNRNVNNSRLNVANQSPPSGSAVAPPLPLLAFGVSNLGYSRFPENRSEPSSSAIHGHVYSQQPAFPYFWNPILHDQPVELEQGKLPQPPAPPIPTVKPRRQAGGGMRPFKCETCSKVFKRSQHLSEHILTHTKEKPFKCQICQKSYSQSGALFVHMRLHTGIRPYKCNICGKAFNQSGCLNVHLLKHTGERPHECQTCGKTFQQKQHLVEHMLSHTAKKKFKCEICEAEFSHFEWSAFNLHKLEHTGKQPHVCDICGKSFAKRKNLGAHKRKHRDAGKKFHQCHVCGQVFKVKNSMERHMRQHTGEKPYKCTVCDKNFTCDRQLQRHLRSNRHDNAVKGIK